ncbi:hypothetical protein [Rhizobium grahamii]|uniref:Tail fiber protein n=1 Tax=Rhizobium grahamii CCGE 502 TaxID=990285 RepID=S3HNG2_9HYPH|nr:hypothetical protein [Rhizobium grahamii]EPE99545.1 hypothetical protein RGCCGE502_05160 [Rhizobium grahamii CCGE 502]
MAAILPSSYKDGTVSVATGSTAVTGTNTFWGTPGGEGNPILPGDWFGVHKGYAIRIASIEGNGALTLANPWPGPPQTDEPYEVMLQSDNARMATSTRQLLQQLMNGNIAAFTGLNGEPDTVPYFTGPGAMGLLTRQDLTQGVDYDVQVDTLADRAAYDLQVPGYAVLVSDIGDGRAAIYSKVTAASGDWSDPAYITGPRGLTWKGAWSGATAYKKDDAVSYNNASWIALVDNTNVAPIVGATWGQLAARGATGATGVNPRGAYDNATAYGVTDSVLDNGSTWIAIAPTTGNAPPVLPTTSNAYWQLLARKGTDGTGTGDVVGPAGGVAASDIVAFDGTTGKLIKKAPNGSVGNALLANMAAGTLKGRRASSGNGAPEDLTPAQVRGEIGAEFLSSIRNKLRNGGFDVWQRGVTWNTPANGAYTADGWKVAYDVAGTFVLSAVTATNEAINPQTWRYLRWNQTVAGAATSRLLMSPIENVHTLAGQTVTVTFEAWATTAQSLAVNLQQIFGTGGSPSASVALAAQTVNLTTTPQKFSLVFNLADVKSKTLGTNGDDYLNLIFGLPLTGTFDIKISRVSLVAGDATQEADPFGPGLDYARILNICERYYQQAYITFAPYAAASVTQAIGVNFRTTMRATPTALGGTVISASGTTVAGYDFLTPQGARMTHTPSGSGVCAIAVNAAFGAEY